MQQERFKKKMQTEQQQNFNLITILHNLNKTRTSDIWCKTCAFNIITLYKPGFHLH